MSDGRPCMCETPTPIASSSPLCACGGVIQVAHASVGEIARIAIEETKIRRELKEAAERAEAIKRTSPGEARIIELLESIAFNADEQTRALRGVSDAIAALDATMGRLAATIRVVGR
jgi:hypothetical protein